MNVPEKPSFGGFLKPLTGWFGADHSFTPPNHPLRLLAAASYMCELEIGEDT